MLNPNALQPEPVLPHHCDDRRAGEHRSTVLVADDNRQLRELLCAVLAPLNCEIVAVGSGEEALTELLQRKVAVIILDVNMPGMGGFETAQLIRETEDLATTPIIFLTGEAGADSDLNKGYGLGAVDFLIKPVSRHVLYAKVKALLELDQSFARLRAEAAEFHSQQLQAARAAEARQREELLFTQRRERLTNVFAEASIDVMALQKAIVTEMSQLFNADCGLRLSSPGRGWHEPMSLAVSGGTSPTMESWLVGRLADQGHQPPPYPEIMVEDLTARGRGVGVVCVGRADGSAFSDIESALFRGVSVAAALAVSNATLYQVQAEYAAVMQASGDAILAVDSAGAIRSCNKAAAALFGADADTLIGRPILEFAADSDRERLRERLDSNLGSKDVPLEMMCVSQDGRHVEVAVTLSPIGDSVELHVAAVVHDLTEIKRAQSEIRYLASHDPLTGLANRRELNSRLVSIVAEHENSGEVAALLYIDVNKFKSVNDTYGHDAGDDLLIAVADRIRSAVRSETLVARVGGDEFIVVLEHLPSVNAATAAGNRILKQVQDEPVSSRSTTLWPSVSMGIACLGDTAQTGEELLYQADLAMFTAKDIRLDEGVVYTDSIGSRFREESHLRARLQDAVKRSEVRMAYQPIVNAATGSLFGIEALIRWRVGDDEVPAREIVSLAETSNQMGVLGRWILNRSFEDYAALGRSDLRLHVNLSPDELLEADFLEKLITTSRASRIAAANVCLEITEHAFIKEPASAYAALHKAKEVGFSLAIDEFGMEYASMTNLLHVPSGWLKIDRSFIAGIIGNERLQSLVRGQIAMASFMQLEPIAVGVETQEQADWLREAGCVLQQGFLYGCPIESTDLAALVETTWAANGGQGSDGSGAT